MSLLRRLRARTSSPRGFTSFDGLTSLLGVAALGVATLSGVFFAPTAEPSDDAAYLSGGTIYFTTDSTDFTFSKADYPGLRAVRVKVQGSGGAGGGFDASATDQGGGAGGGGAGGYAEELLTVDELGESETVTVGPGGVAASASPGGSGQPSSFGSLVSAQGGWGGERAHLNARGGQGGLGANGDFNTAGGPGGSGALVSRVDVVSEGDNSNGGATSLSAQQSYVSVGLGETLTGLDSSKTYRLHVWYDIATRNSTGSDHRYASRVYLNESTYRGLSLARGEWSHLAGSLVWTFSGETSVTFDPRVFSYESSGTGRVYYRSSSWRLEVLSDLGNAGGGVGGSSLLGGGGYGADIAGGAADGGPGRGYGGGGGGGAGADSDASGGDGADGVVIVELLY